MPQGGRLPTAILKEQGGYKKHRHGGRLDEDMELGQVRPIDGLAGPEQELLDDLLATMPEGVLGSVDTIAIKMLLEQHELYRRAAKRVAKNGKDVQARRLMIDCSNLFIKLARELGITPNARAAMKKPSGGNTEDPFMAIFARLAE